MAASNQQLSRRATRKEYPDEPRAVTQSTKTRFCARPSEARVATTA